MSNARDEVHAVERLQPLQAHSGSNPIVIIHSHLRVERRVGQTPPGDHPATAPSECVKIRSRVEEGIETPRPRRIALEVERALPVDALAWERHVPHPAVSHCAEHARLTARAEDERRRARWVLETRELSKPFRYAGDLGRTSIKLAHPIFLQRRQAAVRVLAGRAARDLRQIDTAGAWIVDQTVLDAIAPIALLHYAVE